MSIKKCDSCKCNSCEFNCEYTNMFDCSYCLYYKEYKEYCQYYYNLEVMSSEEFVPEDLEWCKNHYVPQVKKYITCQSFGNIDGMVGSCHWCQEMTPYQWYMCSDYSWYRTMLNSNKIGLKTSEEIIEYINKKKGGYVFENE